MTRQELRGPSMATFIPASEGPPTGAKDVPPDAERCQGQKARAGGWTRCCKRRGHDGRHNNGRFTW